MHLKESANSVNYGINILNEIFECFWFATIAFLIRHVLVLLHLLWVPGLARSTHANDFKVRVPLRQLFHDVVAAIAA